MAHDTLGGVKNKGWGLGGWVRMQRRGEVVVLGGAGSLGSEQHWWSRPWLMTASTPGARTATH